MECNFKQIPGEARKLLDSLRSELPSEVLSDTQRSALWRLTLMYEVMASIVEIHVTNPSDTIDVASIVNGLYHKYLDDWSGWLWK